MKSMLITGGTVFVSKYAAEYFSKGYEVTVLNRNTKKQVNGVDLLEGDRHQLGDSLKQKHFDVVFDITAYDAADIRDLLDALGSFGDYILISSSAVYPETARQPFGEETLCAPNSFWGKYGTDKIEAEETLQSRVPNAYILRPPYLYGPGNNIYREAFLFDCAMEERCFCLPGEGTMQLQFFHVEDLCRFAEMLWTEHPDQRIYNVGNPQSISVKDWAELCYRIAGKQFTYRNIRRDVEQRKYFPFYNYEYTLDVTKQSTLLPSSKSMEDGLKESFNWYLAHRDQVIRKPLLEYIDTML